MYFWLFFLLCVIYSVDIWNKYFDWSARWRPMMAKCWFMAFYFLLIDDKAGNVCSAIVKSPKAN